MPTDFIMDTMSDLTHIVFTVLKILLIGLSLIIVFKGFAWWIGWNRNFSKASGIGKGQKIKANINLSKRNIVNKHSVHSRKSKDEDSSMLNTVLTTSLILQDINDNSDCSHKYHDVGTVHTPIDHGTTHAGFGSGDSGGSGGCDGGGF